MLEAMKVIFHVVEVMDRTAAVAARAGAGGAEAGGGLLCAEFVPSLLMIAVTSLSIETLHTGEVFLESRSRDRYRGHQNW